MELEATENIVSDTTEVETDNKIIEEPSNLYTVPDKAEVEVIENTVLNFTEFETEIMITEQPSVLSIAADDTVDVV